MITEFTVDELSTLMLYSFDINKEYLIQMSSHSPKFKEKVLKNKMKEASTSDEFQNYVSFKRKYNPE